MEFLEVMVYAVFVVIALVVIFALTYVGRAEIGHASQEETDLERAESDVLPCQASSPSFRFDRPDNVAEVIGSYMGAQIYRYAAIHGVECQFDHIFPPEGRMEEEKGACCLAPGLVYLPVRRTEQQFN